MTTRTVKVAIMTYRSAAGVDGCVGYRGQEVDVDDKDLDRFDELNVNPGGDEPWEQERAMINMVSPAAGEETSGRGSGLNTAVTQEQADESDAESDAKQADLEPSQEAQDAADDGGSRRGGGRRGGSRK